MKETLANAGNTIVPAYLALLKRGFSVSCTPIREPDEECWTAENSERRFVAEDPVTLLGLVAIYETYGSEWKASDEDIDRFMAMFGYQ